MLTFVLLATMGLLCFLVVLDTRRINRRRDQGPLCSDEHLARLNLRTQRSVKAEPK